jgi:hypothetical protein
MPNAHYVRNFESIIAALAENGHEVILGFDRRIETLPPEIQEFVDGLLQTHEGSIEIKDLPEPQRSLWSGAARQLRAWRDYSRYFLPCHQRARRCADRAALFVVPPLRLLGRMPQALRVPAARLVGGFCAWAEEVLPIEPRALATIGACAPDVVLLTPLIDLDSDQVDYVKACRALRIPIGHCVASWDNLTNKGVIKAIPDRVFVWNEAQKAEAVELHNVPTDRIIVTGAQLFDQWFNWAPSRDRRSFCAEIGLDPDRQILLYTASSVFICRSEVDFVTRWLKAIRGCDDMNLRSVQVIIRPHPKATKTLSQWDSEELEALGGVAVFPRGGHMPLGVQARNDYYDSLYYSAAVVGINTSAMLEAAVVGRRSFTVLLDDIREGQEGMVHFQHLTRERFLSVAETLEAHICQLSAELAHRGDHSESSDLIKRFVGSFLRPYGLDQAATPRFVFEIEKMEGLIADDLSLVAKCGWLQRVLLLPFVLMAAVYDNASGSIRLRGRRPSRGPKRRASGARGKPQHRSAAAEL